MKNHLLQKRTLITGALLASAPVFIFSSPARVIRLDEGGAVRRFILNEGDITLAESGVGHESWVTITREGKFFDERYGEFEISAAMLDNMVKNFSENVYGQKIFIDVAHRSSDGAAGEVIRLTHERRKLRALVRWNPLGVDAVNNKGYRYFSIEYGDDYQDNEARKKHGATMFGAALCTRPVIKGLDALDRIQLAEAAGDPPTFLHPHLEARLRVQLQENLVNKEQMLNALRAKLLAGKVSAENIEKIISTATKQLANVTDEATIKLFAESYGSIVDQLVAQGPAAVIQLTAPAISGTGLDATAVMALMEKRDADAAAATRTLAEKVTTNRSAFAAAINKVATIPEAVRARVLEECSDLITAEMSADQIKRLAENQLAHIAAASVANQLAQRGFEVRGSVILSVDESNSVKSLQEGLDKRLKLTGKPSAKQLHNLGGTLPKEHEDFVSLCLSEFDARNHIRLAQESKMLAAGTGSVSDVAVPVVWERTVLREQLYELVALNFVNVGTMEFHAILNIPYSFRDTTAAGRDSIRVYEGQGIPRAGIKQTYEEARPLPQKIAFLLSDEMQMLSTNGGIDYDAMADNIRNCGRIVAEDTERLLFDEHIRASDEYAVVNVAAEAVAAVNGVNKYFPLANFPIAKPRVIRDLKGVIQSTLNPIVVTYLTIVRSEYDGSNTQAAGTYYVIDYNIGEIYLVSELGVVVLPANAAAFTVGYFYTTNTYKFDSDLGALTVQQKWDNFLYQFGLRKSVIEDQRFYSTNFGLMSGNVRSQIEQAGGFQANFQKSGTNLTTDGNLGVIKNVPQYKTICPGLMMGDRRLVLGQREQVRLRMLKPWAMEQLYPARTAGGLFTAQKEAYGTQWISVHTPTQLKASLTTMLVYSNTARIARATP